MRHGAFPNPRPWRRTSAFLGAQMLFATAGCAKGSVTSPIGGATGQTVISSATGTGGGVGAPDSGRVTAPQPVSPNIVVDQFGYRTAAEKIAVVRSPVRGFDSGSPFTPGGKYALVEAHTGRKVVEAAPVPWNGGAVDASSGDKAWWFDFSSVTTPGDYFVVDETVNVRSDVFAIADTVYRDVLTQSVRMLFYQRDGFAKTAPYVGVAWVDGPAHMGQCYLYGDGSKTLNRDLHGGWWDAGDFNKYTISGAEDVIRLLRAYEESPGAFFDDYNIPESGNGIPDLLDEIKWELDWLVRMQNADGSVLSIVGEPAAPTPNFYHGPDTSPSKVTDPCAYGPATTAATFSTAAAFAYGSRVYKSVSKASTVYSGFADNLASRAQKAYAWAQANPSVTFYNGGTGVGAGEQEVGAAGLPFKRLEASLYLFELTGDAMYSKAFDTDYTTTNLFKNGYADAYHGGEQEILLGYTKASNATAAVVKAITTKYKVEAESAGNLGAVHANPDPYLAYLNSYVWGSNQIKADQGSLLYDLVSYAIDPSNPDVVRGAERYIHYIHGVNPLQLVYLSNMGDHGAYKSVTRIFHGWFAHGSNWDAAGVSKYGPPPGYLVGGPNPKYTWDKCCPAGCSGNSCGPGQPSPPAGQPDQKSYKDFNDSWPIDSWQVTEPDVEYQAKYIRLLSKFVR
jgi:endoglucanase